PFGRRFPAVLDAGVVASWGLLAILGSACTTVSQGGTQTSLMEATGTKITAQELRTTQSVLAIRVPGTIEEAADAMSAQTADVALRRRALLWKMEVVPAYYQALFNADPLAASLDAWVLTLQLEQDLKTGPRKDAFTPLQSIAVAALEAVRAEMEVTSKQLSKSPQGYERGKALVESWAADHPITGPLASRPSILTHLAELAANGSDISVFQAVGNISASVTDIATRLDIYVAYLPKAGRWQAQLLADELSGRGDAQQVLATFESVKQMMDRANQLVSPEALKSALDVTTAEVRKERLAAFASVDALRLQTQAYVTSEREAALAGVDAQRRLVTAEVDKQRAALLKEVDVLRAQTLADANALASRIIWRGAFAAAGLLVLAALLTVLVLRDALKPRAPRNAS
ncbi:MAG: hypothetical protein ACLPJH_20690, partial [Myxococcaceae bacterium]